MKKPAPFVLLVLFLPPAVAAPDLDGFVRARDAAFDRLVRSEPAQREKAAAELEKLLSEFQRELSRETERLEVLLERAAREGATDAEGAERGRWEHERDRGELLLADARVRYARTLDDPAAREAYRRETSRVLEGCSERAVPPLLYYAYLAQADLLVELGSSEDARSLYEELCLVSKPAEARSETIQDVLLRAHTGWAECLLTTGRPEAGRTVAQQLLEGDAAEVFGRLPGSGRLRITLARAESVCGQPRRAAKRLLALIDTKLEPGALGPEARRACLALADTVDGRVRSGAAHFYAGVGFLLRRDSAAAIGELKTVLVQARGDERKVWISRAVGLLGGLLLKQGRNLEAALLYRIVFGEAELGPTCVARALLAAQRAPSQFGEDPAGGGAVAAISRGLREEAARRTDPSLRARLLFQEAEGLASAKRWAEAASAFARVPDDSPLRALAQARAGRCLLECAGLSGAADDLSAARTRLAAAVRFASSKGEHDPWCLAVLSLARLENGAGDHRAALSWLEAFSGPLRESSRIAFARLEEALARASLAADAPVAEARGAWREAARALKEARLPKGEEGRAWAARIFWRGGELKRARELIMKIPAPSDELVLVRALCDLGLGDPTEAKNGLRGLQQRVFLERGQRVVARGALLRREERGPFEMRYAGRVVRQQVWFDVLEIDGQERTFYELDKGRVVEGTDPTKPYDADDVLALAWPHRERFLVVEGMARATWAEWEVARDARRLVREVAPALNALLDRLRRMSDGDYAAVASRAGVEPPTRSARLWEAEVRWVEVLYAREDWRGVRGHLAMMRLLGRWKRAPAWARKQLLELEARAGKR